MTNCTACNKKIDLSKRTYKIYGDIFCAIACMLKQQKKYGEEIKKQLIKK